MTVTVKQLMTPYAPVEDLIVLRDPHSIVAQQMREWSMVRNDQGYTGDT